MKNRERRRNRKITAAMLRRGRTAGGAAEDEESDTDTEDEKNREERLATRDRVESFPAVEARVLDVCAREYLAVAVQPKRSAKVVEGASSRWTEGGKNQGAYYWKKSGRENRGQEPNKRVFALYKKLAVEFFAVRFPEQWDLAVSALDGPPPLSPGPPAAVVPGTSPGPTPTQCAKLHARFTAGSDRARKVQATRLRQQLWLKAQDSAMKEGGMFLDRWINGFGGLGPTLVPSGTHGGVRGSDETVFQESAEKEAELCALAKLFAEEFEERAQEFQPKVSGGMGGDEEGQRLGGDEDEMMSEVESGDEGEEEEEEIWTDMCLQWNEAVTKLTEDW